MEGTNDISQRVGIESIRFNLDEMASRAEALGMAAGHATVIPRIPTAPADSEYSATSALALAIRTMGEETHRAVVDNFTLFEGLPDVFNNYYSYTTEIVDPVGYPNTDGYIEIGGLFLETILPLLDTPAIAIVPPPNPLTVGALSAFGVDGKAVDQFLHVDWDFGDGGFATTPPPAQPDEPRRHRVVVHQRLLFMTYAIFFSQPQEGRKLKLRKDRQLAAIVFTDVEGYTRLMGMDEDKGLAVLDDNRKLHKKWIAKYRGQLLKEMGDGSIIIFYTATEAVLCGQEMQREVRAEGKYALRIGIHISEVLFTDTDAFGDGVNVASRLCGQAKGGEIVLSESVYQNIRNREDIRIESMGPVELKNVDQPLHLFRINA